MRIALVYLGRRGSGGPISYEIGTNLSKRATVLAVLSENLENLPVWEATGLELLTVPTYTSLPGALISWVNQISLKILASQINAWKPDILLFPMFYTWNPFLQWRLRNIPSIVAVHDPIPHPGLTGFLYGALENLSIRQARWCLTFSQKFKPVLVKRGIHPNRIETIPHGDLSYYHHFSGPPKASRPSDPEVPILLFFGRITPYKGLDILLTAFGEVRSQKRVKLKIVGSGDIQPYLPLILRYSDVEIVNRWIEEQEVAEFFRTASIIVLPYTSASQSGLIPLAASFAKPVVATRVGGIPEQITHERTGLLIEPGSIEQLAEAIIRLLQDPEYAQALGDNLQMDYRQHKNWAQISQKIYTICEKALQVSK